MRKVRWGVFGVARIAVQKVIPAMQKGKHAEVAAIASRSLEKARTAAAQLGIARAYGSYAELLSDHQIDAVYNPLPNHLHVPWSIQALEAGKHVLCEKPIGLDGDDARTLLESARRHPSLKLMEAFMYRHHPQWVTARDLVAEGRIGSLRTIQTFFSYCRRDPEDYRSRPETGGGGLLDIGCYPVSLSRWLFGAEPRRVFAIVELDPEFGVDRLACGLMDFETGASTFTCATQLAPQQRVQIVGTDGCIEIEIPFNAPNDRPCRIWHQTAAGTRAIDLDACDQYTIQGDLFSEAVLDNGPVPTPLEDAVNNMAVIDAMFRSARSGVWETV